MDNKKKCLCMIAILIAFMAFAYASSISVPTISTGNITYINATSIVCTGCSSSSGNDVTNLSSLDGVYWYGNESNAQPLTVDINFTNVTMFDYSETMSKYFSSTGTPSSHVVHLEIFCTDENQFVDLREYTNNDEWTFFTKKFPSSHHFIQAGGNVTIRFNHTSNGLSAHRIWIDDARLAIQPTFNNVTNHYTNITNISSGADNASLNLKVNKSGDILTGSLYNIFGVITNSINLSGGSSILRAVNSTTGNTSDIIIIPEEIGISVSDGATTGIFITPTDITIEIEGTNNYILNSTDFDLSNKNITNCANCSKFSKLIKTTSYINGSVMTGTTTIPHDDTIPQITEGNLFGNITITPQSANSKIKTCAQVVMATNTVTPNLLQVLIFIGNNTNATAISSAYSPAANYEINTGVCYTTSVPSVSPFNVSIRYGSNAAGTITVNGGAGARLYGGAYNSYIIVDEYKD